MEKATSERENRTARTVLVLANEAQELMSNAKRVQAVVDALAKEYDVIVPPVPSGEPV